MTTPHERMRSLRWGYELLVSLKTDPSIPEPLIARAEVLVKTYPTPTALTSIVEADPPQLPDGFGESFDGTRALFEEILSGCFGSEETRTGVLYALRHFPLRGASERAADAIWAGSLIYWIAREDALP